jgi:gamma-glutamyl:cysteine ligase YbdK (ATP-grasp superfamily)
VEHRFTGPSFTLGIEEELMIVDGETLELTNSIEGLLDALADTPREAVSHTAQRRSLRVIGRGKDLPPHDEACARLTAALEEVGLAVAATTLQALK